MTSLAERRALLARRIADAEQLFAKSRPGAEQRDVLDLLTELRSAQRLLSCESPDLREALQ